MNVKLKNKSTPPDWHIMATKKTFTYFVHWQHIKNEKPDKNEVLTPDEFDLKYESL